MGIIDSVKRLERAGSEHSIATQKLKHACYDVAVFLENALTGIRPKEGDINLLIFDKLYISCYGRIQWITGTCEPWLYEITANDGMANGLSRNLCLDFSKAIADGLIGNVVDFLKDEKDKVIEASIRAGIQCGRL